MDAWKRIYNATEHYLKNDPSYTIILTTYQKYTPIVKKMELWAKENAKGSWSIMHSDKYEQYITFRFWDKSTIELFKEEFKEYLFEG